MQSQQTYKTEIAQHLVEWSTSKLSSHIIGVFAFGVSLR